MNLRCYLNLIFLVSLLPSGLSAQTQIRGSVYDLFHRKPLAGVEVSVEGSSIQVLTDRRGFFALPAVDSGAFPLIFRKTGYQTERRVVDLLGSEVVFSVGVGLSPNGMRPEEKTVDQAHGYERPTILSPFASRSLPSQQWQRWQSRSLPEALAGEPGFWLGSPHYGTPTLQIRGLDARRQGWTYEGLPLSTSLQLPGSNPILGLIDHWALDQVEILPGGGPALNDAGASAAQIQLSSRAPALSWKKLVVHGQLRHEQFSNQVGASTRLGVSVHAPKIGLRLGATRRNWGDLLPGGGTLPIEETGYRQNNFDLTLKLPLGARQELVLGHRYGRLRDLNLIGLFRPNPTQASEEERSHQLSFARYQLHLDNPYLTRLKVTAGYQAFSSTLTRQAALPQVAHQELLDLNLWSGQAEVLSELNPLWHIVTGVQVLGEQVSAQQTLLDPGSGGNLPPTLLPHGAQSSQWSLYSLHTLDLLKLRLVFGGRAQADFRNGPRPDLAPLDWRSLRFNGKVGGMYPLSSNYEVFSNLRTGYRAPGLFELAGFGDVPIGISVPADTLRGERAYTTEIGIKARTDRFAGTLALYRTRFANGITYKPGTWQGQSFFQEQPVWVASNVRRSFVQGLEASLEVPIVSVLSLYGSVVYTYGERVSQGEPMDRIPPINSRLGLFFEHPLGIWSRLEWRYAGTQDLLAPLDRRDPAVGSAGVPGWNLLDLKLGYEFRWGYLTLGLLNILDESYVYVGSDIPGQGRTLVGSVQLGF